MIEPNSARRSKVARELLPELREHMGAYGVLVHQYCKHFALSRRSKQGVVQHVLQIHSLQTFRNLRQIAVCVNQMGGVPIGSMLELVDQAYLEPEPEGLLAWHQMLLHDQQLEHQNNLRLALTEETALELKARNLARHLAILRLAGLERLARLEQVARDWQVN